MEKKKYLETLESSDDEEQIYIPKGKKGASSAAQDQTRAKNDELSVKKHDEKLIKTIISDIANTEKQPKPKKTEKVEPEKAVEMTEAKPARKKREISEATKENLRKGREALKLYWEGQRQKKEELAEKYAIKKANKAINQKMKIKKELACEDMSSDEEDPIIFSKPEPVREEKPVKKKSSKKKQTIIIQQQSDSSSDEDSEPIIMSKTTKNKPKDNPLPPPPSGPPQKRDIVFF